MSKWPTSILNGLRNGVTNAWNSRFYIRPLSESQTELEFWLQTPLGQRLISQQQQHISRLLRCIFGYHIMQLSISQRLDLTTDSPINHRFQLSPQMPRKKPNFVDAVANFGYLPVDSESIDLAILHHVLDYSPNPYQILYESSRVIIPNGHLLIVGFNPWSLSGLCQRIARVTVNSPQWRHHSLSLARVINWLRLLDFEPVCKQYGYYGLPTNSYCRQTDIVGRKLLPFCGAFYVLLACKQVARMTPVKSPKQTFKPLPQWGKISPIPRKQRQ